MSAPYASSLARDVHLGEESETQLVYIGEGGDGIVTKITQGDKIWVRKQFYNYEPDDPEEVKPRDAYEVELAVYRHIQRVDQDSTTPLTSITPRMFGTSIDPGSSCRCIDLEYIEGVQLADLLWSATPKEIEEYEAAVLRQLDCLHEAGISHGDLNLQNIMVRTGVGCQDLDNRVVFIDFGLANLRHSNMSDVIWETHIYQDKVLLRTEISHELDGVR